MKKIIGWLCITIFISSLGMVGLNWMNQNNDQENLNHELEELRKTKQEEIVEVSAEDDHLAIKKNEEESLELQILPQYQSIYEENTDFIGWMKIEGTRIDYPVMYTPNDETYYLHRDFQKQENENGSLFVDTDTQVGDELQEPTTNIIIHGHDMKSGEMFGELDLFQDQAYYEEHKMISFDTLYEQRKYQVISVFLSQVYKKSDDVFKYYKFFNAEDEEAFDNFYSNIKAMSLYDTGIEAQYGDEFITLSTCAYHVENGRLVVVAKRIQ